MKNEIWKPIDGYDHPYKVSNHWGSMLTETVADDFCSYGERKDNA